MFRLPDRFVTGNRNGFRRSGPVHRFSPVRAADSPPTRPVRDGSLRTPRSFRTRHRPTGTRPVQDGDPRTPRSFRTRHRPTGTRPVQDGDPRTPRSFRTRQRPTGTRPVQDGDPRTSRSFRTRQRPARIDGPPAPAPSSDGGPRICGPSRPSRRTPTASIGGSPASGPSGTESCGPSGPALRRRMPAGFRPVRVGSRSASGASGSGACESSRRPEALPLGIPAGWRSLRKGGRSAARFPHRRPCQPSPVDLPLPRGRLGRSALAGARVGPLSRRPMAGSGAEVGSPSATECDNALNDCSSLKALPDPVGVRSASASGPVADGSDQRMWSCEVDRWCVSPPTARSAVSGHLNGQGPPSDAVM